MREKLLDVEAVKSLKEEKTETFKRLSIPPSLSQALWGVA